VTGRLRALWDLPPADGATGPRTRDWILVAVLLVAAGLEGTLRADVVWRPIAVALAVVVVLCLPWRRVRPTGSVAVAFGSIVAVQLSAIALGAASVGLVSTACVLLVAFAGARWGSGRTLVLLVSLLVVLFALGRGRDYRTLTDAVGELVILALPVVVGLAVRAQATSRERELERVRADERVQLARDLHDTVAHHVSAMVVRAQAGRVVAAADPAAAVDALRVIEAEGSRTLAEMRALVGALRDRGDPRLAPTASVRDVEGLAVGRPGAPEVRVSISGDIDGVNPAVAAAVYRIAQESVTNATRHATGAGHVDVDVTTDGGLLRLTVRDDGRPASTSSGGGFGIVGMRERATLLGGSLHAGPDHGGGWVVDVVLPRTGEGR
jgi:signal transduction histidine kinase